MDIGWLFAVPAAGVGFCAGWIVKPERAAQPAPELRARMADVERHMHQHAPEQKPVVTHGPHGPDYVAWGHDGKAHWRRHRDGTIEHSADGTF